MDHDEFYDGAFDMDDCFEGDDPFECLDDNADLEEFEAERLVRLQDAGEE